SFRRGEYRASRSTSQWNSPVAKGFDFPYSLQRHQGESKSVGRVRPEVPLIETGAFSSNSTHLIGRGVQVYSRSRVTQRVASNPFTDKSVLVCRPRRSRNYRSCTYIP